MTRKVTVKDQSFDNWDDALRYANRLFNKGEISKAEINQIASSAEQGELSGGARKVLKQLQRG